MAHRGLHDGVTVIENTPSAVAAAIAAGYGIEVDLQITADGEAMVHHDDALGRLTEGEGRLAAMTAAELKRVPFKRTADRMMTLGDLLDLVGGRATLLLELKSHWDGDRRLVERVSRTLGRSVAPIAAMSFDPFQIAAIRERAPALHARHRGGAPAARTGATEAETGKPARLLARRFPKPATIHRLSCEGPAGAGAVRGAKNARPAAARLDGAQRRRPPARRTLWADQMIFEGFRP